MLLRLESGHSRAPLTERTGAREEGASGAVLRPWARNSSLGRKSHREPVGSENCPGLVRVVATSHFKAIEYSECGYNCKHTMDFKDRTKKRDVIYLINNVYVLVTF